MNIIQIKEDFWKLAPPVSKTWIVSSDDQILLLGIDVPLTSPVLLHLENRGEITTEPPDEPLQDKQMQIVHVNETTVLHQNYSRPRGKSKEKDYCRISLGDLQQQFGKKRNDAAESLGGKKPALSLTILFRYTVHTTLLRLFC